MAKAKLEFQERLDRGRRGANEKITSVEGGGGFILSGTSHFILLLYFQFNELVSSVSNIMETDAELLLQAQRRFKACSRYIFRLSIFYF